MEVRLVRIDPQGYVLGAIAVFTEIKSSFFHSKVPLSKYTFDTRLIFNCFKLTIRNLCFIFQ